MRRALLLGAELDPPGTEVVVAFSRHRFEPATVRVRAGALVTFHSIDAGPGPSTIVASDGSFESWPIAPNGEWSHRFEKPGVYAYALAEHPGTTGKAIAE